MHVLKRRGSYIVLKVAMAIIMMIVMFGSGLYFGSSAIRSYKADVIRQEAAAIDHALMLYSQSHTAVAGIEKTEGGTYPFYKAASVPAYPKTLEDLGAVQTELGYVSDLIKFTDKVDADDPGKFIYTPHMDENGNYSSYTLKAYLPGGYLYTSPGSRKE